MRATTSQASPEPGPWLERTFRGLLLCAVALFATCPMLSSGRRAVLALLGGVVLSVIALTIGWKWRQQLFFVAPEQQTRALEQHQTEMLELRAELKRLQDAMEARSVAASEASALSPCGVGLPAGVPRPSQPVPAPPGLQLGLPPAPPPAEQGGDIWAFRDFAENRRPEGPISHTGLRAGLVPAGLPAPAITEARLEVAPQPSNEAYPSVDELTAQPPSLAAQVRAVRERLEEATAWRSV